MRKIQRRTVLRSASFAALIAVGSLTTNNAGWAQIASQSSGKASLGGEASWTAASLPPSAPLNTAIFPLAEVKRGLRGVAYTVFEGVVPEPMEVEILGVLRDSLGPGQDMILGRLRGEKAEYTGVVAGMSGSPVYVDGKLLGSLSYRIGQFSKEAICGITPIEQMLEVRESTIRQYGAVSEMTVREMVAGALQHSSAQVALAVSGIAGPDGGTAEKPVGTVWFAWGLKDGETRAQRYQLDGNRSEVRAQAVHIALQGVVNFLNNRTETA